MKNKVNKSKEGVNKSNGACPIVKKVNLLCGLIGLIAVAALSCSKMNDLHDPYLRDGKIMYTGKVDSAKVFAGENRIMLRYYTSDPKAKNLLAYWNLKTDSSLFAIPDKNAGDPVDVYIDKMEEGPVFFELFTLNVNMENQSVLHNVAGRVYGDRFRASLTNRNIRSIIRGMDGKVTIEWYGADQRSVGCQIRYTNILGVTVDDFMVPSNESVTVIDDMDEDAEHIWYQTVYMPEPDAIDKFYAATRQVNVISGKITEINDNPIEPLPGFDGEDY